MWCLPSFRSVPVLPTTVIQTFAQCARERRASRLCSRACAVLSLVCRLADSCSSSQLAACRAGLSAGRGRVRLTSIDFSGASRQSGTSLRCGDNVWVTAPLDSEGENENSGFSLYL